MCFINRFFQKIFKRNRFLPDLSSRSLVSAVNLQKLLNSNLEACEKLLSCFKNHYLTD